MSVAIKVCERDDLHGLILVDLDVTVGVGRHYLAEKYRDRQPSQEGIPHEKKGAFDDGWQEVAPTQDKYEVEQNGLGSVVEPEGKLRRPACVLPNRR